MERNEALKLLLNKYNTGRPCRNGHLSDRYTVSGSCIRCISANTIDFRNRATAQLDQFDVKTEVIYVNIHKNDAAIVKAILDAFVFKFCPEFNPDSLNPFPFKTVKTLDSGNVLKTLVRVPRGKVDEVRRVTEQLRLASSEPLKKPDFSVVMQPSRDKSELDVNNIS